MRIVILKCCCDYSKTIEQSLMPLIQNSTNLNHLLQIHSLIIKTSLHHHYSNLLRQLFSLSNNLPNSLLPHARSLFDAIPFPGTFVWNTMMRAYLNSQNPLQSLSLFAQMRSQDRVSIDSFSLSLVLQACGKLGDYQNGLTIHTHVVKLGFSSDLFVVSCLIQMFAKCGFLDIAREVFDEMADPDLVSYNIMLAEYVRVGEIGLTKELFDKMPDKDLVSWNTIIHGYVSLGNVGIGRMLLNDSGDEDIVSWKAKQSNKALSLFHEMQLENVVPDNVTLVSVLCACGDVGALGMGKMVHEYIERNRIKIDMKLGTSLVDMYAKCGDIDNSIKVFDGMSRRDVFAWSAMIMGLARHGFGEAALDHFSELISEGIKPNEITFVGVLVACSHIGLVDKGWAYFNSMSDVYGIIRKIEHYGCMVDILGRAGRLEEARELIRSMPIEPDAVVWRALLGACRINKNVELAEEATRKLLLLEPHMDGNYVLLANIYSKVKKWDKVVNIRRMLKNTNLQKVPGSSSIEVDNVAHEFLAGDKSHPQSEEIYQLLAEINDRLRYAGSEPFTPSDLRSKETALAHQVKS